MEKFVAIVIVFLIGALTAWSLPAFALLQANPMAWHPIFRLIAGAFLVWWSAQMISHDWDKHTG
jgi:hypothetical protein